MNSKEEEEGNCTYKLQRKEIVVFKIHFCCLKGKPAGNFWDINDPYRRYFFHHCKILIFCIRIWGGKSVHVCSSVNKTKYWKYEISEKINLVPIWVKNMWLYYVHMKTWLCYYESDIWVLVRRNLKNQNEEESQKPKMRAVDNFVI